VRFRLGALILCEKQLSWVHGKGVIISFVHCEEHKAILVPSFLRPDGSYPGLFLPVAVRRNPSRAYGDGGS